MGSTPRKRPATNRTRGFLGPYTRLRRVLTPVPDQACLALAVYDTFASTTDVIHEEVQHWDVEQRWKIDAVQSDDEMDESNTYPTFVYLTARQPATAPLRRQAMIPTQEQLHDWAQEVEDLIDEATQRDLHHDLHTVLGRIEREQVKRRTLEGGCAFRVMRLANQFCGYGEAELAARCHRLAHTLVQHENLPSPTWEQMCAEMNWPLQPTAQENA